jgi:hypothetical protein
VLDHDTHRAGLNIGATSRCSNTQGFAVIEDVGPACEFWANPSVNSASGAGDVRRPIHARRTEDRGGRRT